MMRFLSAPSTLLHTTAILLASQTALAKPYPRDADTEDVLQLQNSTLAARSGCENPCGWSGQLCCAAGQTCYTDSNNQAQCGGSGVSAAGGYWQYYTSTWVETGLVTRTAVYSSYVGGVVATVAQTTYAPVATPTCRYYLNESPCGTICCASGQYCLKEGHCAAGGGASSGVGGVIGGVYSTPAYSAPVRPTSSTLIVVTATVSPTMTVPFETPVATGANVTITATSAQASTGLSGGEIAGIVIGVIAGIILLILICFAFCLRGAAGILGGLFGGGKKRRREEEVYIEEHHRHGGSAAAGGRRWYGDSPGRPQRPQQPQQKKSSGFGNLGAIAAGLGGLAVALGLKRRYDRRQEEKSDTTGYSYYSSDYTSESSESSDRRTRDTRRSSGRR